MAEEDPWLGLGEVAARAHVRPDTWRSYVKRGYAPPPDDPDDQDPGVPKERRRRRWRTSTVDAYLASRPGQGRRTDLAEARAKQRHRDAADLAAPAPAPPPAALSDWLRTNHAGLLEVADALVDARDELLDVVADPDGLAEAVDAAGERMDRGPSKAFASAVAYAIGLTRGVALDPDSDLSRALHRHGHLHAEFGPYAGS